MDEEGPQAIPTTMKTTTTAVIDTTMGSFEVELFTDKMPITTGNFIDLVEKHKFYDGLYIHRVDPSMCIQMGCPYSNEEPPHVMYGTLHEDTGQGSGPPETTFTAANTEATEHARDEYGNIEDELVRDDSLLSNRKYTVSMANSGEPDTGGSQFFINLNDNTHFDWWNGESESAHPTFGIINNKDSQAIVDKIAAVETDAEQPVNPIKISSVRIINATTTK
jgi:cyclophilin family peptidyl-prolyl cis-trans isomerase